jgi:hypothetical protein
MTVLYRRIVRPALFLVLGLMRIAVYGIRSIRRDSTKSVWLAHRLGAERSDLARFMAKLANRYDAADAECRQSLEIILLADSDAALSDYMFIPYLVTPFFSVHVVYSADELDALLPTLGGAALAAIIKSDLMHSHDRIDIDCKAIDGIRLPALFMNRGREFMKTNDWKLRYCAVSIASAISMPNWAEAFEEAAKSYPGWRFLLLDTNALVGIDIDTLPPNVVVPGGSSIDFLSQMAIAMQADAYIGEVDIFGASAAMAGVPAVFLADANEKTAVRFVEPNSNLRYAAGGSVVADELQKLLSAQNALIQAWPNRISAEPAF